MGTKTDPGEFDCYDRAEDDEPIFVLLARDEDAAALVHEWAKRRHARLIERYGYTAAWPEGEAQQIVEAQSCAETMTRWRHEHRPDT